MPKLGRVTYAMEKDQVTSYRHLSLPREAAKVLLIGLEFWGFGVMEVKGCQSETRFGISFHFHPQQFPHLLSQHCQRAFTHSLVTVHPDLLC